MASLPHPHLASNLVSEMITPGILILAAGSLINTTLLRLSRSVDRARLLIETANAQRAAGSMAQAEITAARLRLYGRRVRLLENAMTVGYAAIFLFVASTLFIALNTALDDAISWLPPITVILGACCLFYSAARLTVEATIAAGTLRREIDEAMVVRES